MACCSWATGRFRTVFWAVLVVLLLGVGGAVALHLLGPQPPKPRQPDWVAVMQANNRGVGHMERFKFVEAVKEFEEVNRLAPDWQPGQVNLGIAFMNLARGLQDEERSETE